MLLVNLLNSMKNINKVTIIESELIELYRKNGKIKKLTMEDVEEKLNIPFYRNLYTLSRIADEKRFSGSAVYNGKSILIIHSQGIDDYYSGKTLGSKKNNFFPYYKL